MSNRKNISKLADAIQDFSPADMTADEASDAARNLSGFFSLLIEIDREQSTNKEKEGVLRRILTMQNSYSLSNGSTLSIRN